MPRLCPVLLLPSLSSSKRAAGATRASRVSERTGSPVFKFKPYLYNQNEGTGPWWLTAEWALWPTLFGRFCGTIAKGWWKLGWGEINRHFEVGVALGGEDNMVQGELVLPFLGRAAIGVRVPGVLTRPWIYERREWAIRVGYIGRWFEVLIGRDESAADMASYYRARRKAGEELAWSRLELWPGLHLSVNPHPLDRLFGRTVCSVTKSEPTPVVVPMAEASYMGAMRREDRVWKRQRWPWASRKQTGYWIDMESGVPVPGKGENSWDCDEDAIMGAGGTTPAAAVASVVGAALRQRERYGGSNWAPPKEPVAA
jgi:hypothetical protein